MDNIESCLCRYYSNEEFILDVIKNKRLHFCDPDKFNDPFDCRPMILIKHSQCYDDEVWRDFFYCLAKLQYSGEKESEIEKHALAAYTMGLHEDPKFLTGMTESLQVLGKDVRVCCFTKSSKNPVMWAHYADNNEGVVFQFDKTYLYDTRTNEFRGQEVKYVGEPFDVEDYVQAMRALFENDYRPMCDIVYATKRMEWQYEKEVRFFSRMEKEYVEFDEKALSGIVFGGKCSGDLIKKIQEELKNWLNSPQLLQVSLQKSICTLHIQEYTE